MELTAKQITAIAELQIKVDATEYKDWRQMRDHKVELAKILKGEQQCL